jgi:cell division protein ZapE
VSLNHLVDVVPFVSPGQLIEELVPPRRFDAVRFSTYRPDPSEKSQSTALDALSEIARNIAEPPKKGWFRRPSTPSVDAVYLDGGFGVGKTHLLASLWHEVPGPKAYGTFVEYTHLAGAVGFGETIERLSGHRLVAVDEFELDDPGDTMLMTRLLGELADAGVFLAATSNTLPDRLGEGRFAAEEFRREIRGLSSRFTTLRIDGPDFRHVGLARAPKPMSDSELVAAAGHTAGATLDTFDALTARLAKLHPSTYGKLVEVASAVHISDVEPISDQSEALRWVVLIDRLYDRTIPVRASGASLDQLFTPEMLKGGYRKKYLRATSRILALAREGG